MYLNTGDRNNNGSAEDERAARRKPTQWAAEPDEGDHPECCRQVQVSGVLEIRRDE
jgi:hypothetical protein